ncbi:uncharacterized protein si:dkey-283b1.6 isoform X1 [Oncorhynchus mykiss]|uniref:uncharacterized protein si:dkey-283b1.6 isoform X1 n=1 Tax=Oncorhynchus mykiss TaxID=8022 RepID=UPI000B4E8A2C|nr:uncharacterized protein si:dkey-283b1.6 isoform X1 [Oncorhynchus mykiss]
MPIQESFYFLEIFIPMITFGITIICCTAFCKAFHRARQEQLDREERRDRPSIYVIPFPAVSYDSEDIHRPPRYSTSEFSSPPPAYNEVLVHPKHEVEMKPDFIHPELPPAYSEVSNAPVFPLQPYSASPEPHSQP